MTQLQEITPSAKISRNTENMFSKIDSETVVMSIENDSYYGIDAVGSRIWELIDEKTTLENLIETLHKEFEAQPGQIESDTLTFLQKLLKENLILIEN
jgi:hypothetical protein